MPIGNNILMGASAQSGADLGDEIPQSLAFESDDYLKWDNGSQSGDDRTQWTMSMWVKMAVGTAEECLFSGWQNSNNRFELTYRNTQQLELTEWGGGSAKVFRVTNRRFRDPAAWYHFVIIYDVDNSTANDQLRLYVNGKRETDFASNANDSGWAGVFGDSGTTTTYGGKWNGSGITNGFNGCIAMPIMLDGIIVSEDADGYLTEFGRLNNKGVWVPKDYTGNYGTNGWKLTLKKGQANSIGTDSGNSNNFSNTGFNIDDISATNQINNVRKDTPTINYAVMNPLRTRLGWEDNEQEFTRANLQVTSAGTNVSYTQATIVPKNKIYFEMGPVTGANERNYPGLSLFDSQNRGTSAAANSKTNILNTGAVSCEVGTGPGNMEDWFQNDTAMWTWDPSTHELTQEINDDGTVTTKDFSNNIDGGLPDKELGIGLVHYRPDGRANINFGNMDFVHGSSMPSGCVELNSNTLPEPKVKDGSDHFEIVHYTGSTSTDPEVNSLNFKPDLIWIKRHGDNSSHIVDDVRGFDQALASNLTNGNFTSGLKSIDDNGFTVDKSGGNAVSANGDTYSAWCWKAGGKPTATNTETSGAMTANSVIIDGVLQSAYTPHSSASIRLKKLSVNTTAGFSTGLFTGTGSAGNIPHGLGVRPAFIIIKRVGQDGNDWCVYHERCGPDKKLLLNSENAQDNDENGFDAAPDEHIINVGSGTGMDTNLGPSNGDHVFYAWAPVEGFSKFDGYRGFSNSHTNTSGPFIYCGFKPRWVMIKAQTRSEPWLIFDTLNNQFNPSNNKYETHSTAGFSTYGEGIDIVSNGFRVRAGASLGEAGNDFLYMAFADHPFGGENTAPITAH